MFVAETLVGEMKAFIEETTNQFVRICQHLKLDSSGSFEYSSSLESMIYFEGHRLLENK